MAKTQTTDKPATTYAPLFDPGTFYTISVFLFNATNSDNCRALQYVNQSAENLEKFKEIVYKNGIAYKDKKNGAIELIPPHNIQTILILPQKEKNAAALPEFSAPVAGE